MTYEEKHLPAPEIQRALADQRLEQLKQEHYNLVIQETLLDAQEGAGKDQELRNTRSRMKNLRASIDALQGLIDEMPEPEKPKNQDGF